MLTVIGEALVDLVDSGNHRTFTAIPGGSPLNVAVGLARLGHPTALLARLGTDAFGRMLRAHASGNGVDLDAAPAAREPSTLAVVSLDDDGRASYDFYLDGTADWQWRAEELTRVPQGTTVLHTGSLASWTQPGDALIADRVRELRAGGQMLISYDPNVRPRLLGTPERGRALVERSVASAHVVKASDEDLTWLYPGREVGQVADAWLGFGASWVVVTRGGEGATAFRRGQPPVHRAAPRVRLVDTVGAGDAFMTGLLGSLVDRRVGVAGLDTLAAGTVAAVLDDAALVAAITCERPGADPPTRAELEQRRT